MENKVTILNHVKVPLRHSYYKIFSLQINLTRNKKKHF